VIWDLEQDSKYLKLMVSDASSVVVFEFVYTESGTGTERDPRVVDTVRSSAC